MNILVTGANGNLGQVVCRHLESLGHFVEATLGPGAKLRFDSDRLRAEAVDLMREEEVEAYVERLLQRHQRLDAAVLLAGGFGMGHLRDTDRETLDGMIDLNFRTAYHVARPVFRHFEAAGGGRFVFIASKPVFHPAAGKDLFGYALSKSMLVRLADLINAEPERKDIAAAVIAPSIIDTPPNRENMPDADPDDWVPPQRIAEAIAFLLSDAGRMLREPVFKLYNKA